MDLKIKNKKALVFGASTGLGRAIAKSLTDEGVQVAIASRNLEKLEKAKIETGAVKVLKVDMSVQNSAALAIADLEKNWGNIDILVINTGGPKRGNFDDVSQEDWKESYQSLWASSIEAIHAALPAMKQNKWGRILLVTSFAAKEPMPNLIISNSYRAGLLGLAKSLSNEVASFGITINALLPGYTRTARVLELGVSEEKIAVNIPAKRFGDPEEFAALASFLSSTQAAYITGQAIAVDGGYLRGL
jgi:3-oxoacyl-[acyl-carrier protein] reductase